MTLEEAIRQRLEEATKEVQTQSVVAPVVVEEEIDEAKKIDLTKKEKEELEIVTKPKTEVTKESVSEQLDALLESVELTEEFKEQAAVIFAAAVQDKVLQIEEELQTQFDSELATAKSELDKNIDGFLSEAIQQWKAENAVAIKANFNSQVVESFMDGMLTLMAEHNFDLPEVKRDALEIVMEQVEELKESVASKDAQLDSLVNEVTKLKAEKILESFNKKMTKTEFDRFSQLAESLQFKDEAQYEKQLGIILENFGQTKQAPKVEQTQMITEVSGITQVISETTGDVLAYANYMTSK